MFVIALKEKLSREKTSYVGDLFKEGHKERRDDFFIL